MAYESCVDASAPKCRNIAAALHRVPGLVTAFENYETDFANYLEGDDCNEFSQDVERVVSTLRETRELAQGALADLRKTGAIESAATLAEQDEPVFSANDGEYEDPTSIAVADLFDRIYAVHGRLLEIEHIYARAHAEAKGDQRVTLVPSDPEHLERELLMIDRLVPLALAKADELRELVPAE